MFGILEDGVNSPADRHRRQKILRCTRIETDSRSTQDSDKNASTGANRVVLREGRAMRICKRIVPKLVWANFVEGVRMGSYRWHRVCQDISTINLASVSGDFLHLSRYDEALSFSSGSPFRCTRQERVQRRTVPGTVTFHPISAPFPHAIPRFLERVLVSDRRFFCASGPNGGTSSGRAGRTAGRRDHSRNQ